VLVAGFSTGSYSDNVAHRQHTHQRLTKIAARHDLTAIRISQQEWLAIRIRIEIKKRLKSQGVGLRVPPGLWFVPAVTKAPTAIPSYRCPQA
jgi:hypothetical protein